MENKKISFSSNTLKIIAVVTMTIDHIGVFIPNMPFFLRMIGRLAAPIFFFTLAFSFQNTSSRKKFLLRLYITSVIMELIKIIAFLIDNKTKNIVQNNVFSTMFLAVLIAMCFENIVISFKSANYAVSFSYIAIFLIVVFWSFISFKMSDMALWIVKAIAPTIPQAEGGLEWVLLGVGMCLFATKKKSVVIFYTLYCVLELVGTIYSTGIKSLMYNIQWMMIFAIPLFLLYNGKKGKGNKWFFYLYYPLHIWVLYLVGTLLR